MSVALAQKAYGGVTLPKLPESPSQRCPHSKSPPNSARSVTSLPKLTVKVYSKNIDKNSKRTKGRNSLSSSVGSGKIRLPKIRGSQPKDKKVSAASDYSNLKGRERCIYLAEPKTSKAIWLTSFGPKLVWGNQETMWPISPAAMKTEPSQRVEQLSIPKRDFRHTLDGKKRIHVFSCGRNSVIWEVSPLAMKAEPSDRLGYLAESKRLPQLYQEDRPKHNFSCGRESPIWDVTNAAKKAQEKERLESLARAKTPHRDYQLPRDVETTVSKNARRAVATSRIEQLARPKSRPHGPFREPKWPVSDNAKQANASTRQQELAKPKGVADGYLPARPVLWDVKRSALRALATSRTNELSRPIERATMDHVQFNPDAFIVSEAAKKARCPARIEELAQPITR